MQQCKCISNQYKMMNRNKGTIILKHKEETKLKGENDNKRKYDDHIRMGSPEMEEIDQSYPWIKRKYFTCENELNCVRVSNVNCKDNINILYSPSDNEQLSDVIPWLVDLSSNLKTDVICYQTKPKENEYEKKEEIEMLLRHLTTTMGMRARFILMGQSSGCYTCILAEYARKNIIGAILISPVWIFKGTVKSSQSRNLESIGKKLSDLVSQIPVPVLIIHGKKDTKSHYFNSIAIGKNIKYSIGWYPKKGDHCNIITKYRLKFYNKIKFFLTQFVLCKIVTSPTSPKRRKVTYKLEENFIMTNCLSNTSGVIKNVTGNMTSQLLRSTYASYNKKNECPFESKEEAEINEKEVDLNNIERILDEISLIDI